LYHKDSLFLDLGEIGLYKIDDMAGGKSEFI